MAACWRHYSDLILLEDYTLSSHPQSAIEHWLGALQVSLQYNDSKASEVLNLWVQAAAMQENLIFTFALTALDTGSTGVCTNRLKESR
jgi:hypothetical protein